MFSAETRLSKASGQKMRSEVGDQKKLGVTGRKRRQFGDFICLPDFGASTRVDQLRDADSILDSLFS